jgi:hypothetical protein
MRLRPLALAACFAFGALVAPAALLPAAAQSEPLLLTTEELMQATALDEVFTQFGPVIEAAPRDQNVPMPSAMQAVWHEAAQSVFVADAMHKSLAQTLEGRFSEEDIAAFAAFFRSPFGIQISRIERDVTVLGPESQVVARDEGLKLVAMETPRRHAQVDEMLKLVSAELATAMVSESIRGMMIGMAMTERRGDIEVPWQEIDAAVQAMMPAIVADVEITQRAMMFYAYRGLSDDELEQYLEFLRTDAAQRLYAVAAYAVGEIIAERMRTFGETIATMLRRIDV